jgi:predicted metalloprotease
MSLAKLIETNNVRTQDDPSQIGGGSSSSSLTQRTGDRRMQPGQRRYGLRERGVKVQSAGSRTPRRSRRALVVIAPLICLMLILLPTYTSVAFAQEETAEESLVEGIVANLNAYWEEQFRLLGYPYSPPTLVFLYDDELVFGPCGFAFTGLGPAYCPYDGTLYYPIDWVDPATGLRLEEYGESAMEMVVAHEIAHHAQVQMERLGIQGTDATPGTQMELEADCLAGVYANQGITEPGGNEAALTALGEAGGPGHGSSQQRVAAFELGYSTGDPAQCLALGDGGGTTTEGGDSGIA